jgi:hypothetical protein
MIRAIAGDKYESSSTRQHATYLIAISGLSQRTLGSVPRNGLKEKDTIYDFSSCETGV